MKLDNPDLSEHDWLVDAVHEGLAELHAVELASFPVEAHDGALERLMIATDIGVIEGTISGPPVDGFPGLVLDLRLWKDVKVSARARVDALRGAHEARALLTINDRTISSWSLNTRTAANEFIGVVLAEASKVR